MCWRTPSAAPPLNPRVASTGEFEPVKGVTLTKEDHDAYKSWNHISASVRAFRTRAHRDVSGHDHAALRSRTGISVRGSRLLEKGDRRAARKGAAREGTAREEGQAGRLRVCHHVMPTRRHCARARPAGGVAHAACRGCSFFNTRELNGHVPPLETRERQAALWVPGSTRRPASPASMLGESPENCCRPRFESR